MTAFTLDDTPPSESDEDVEVKANPELSELRQSSGVYEVDVMDLTKTMDTTPIAEPIDVDAIALSNTHNSGNGDENEQQRASSESRKETSSVEVDPGSPFLKGEEPEIDERECTIRPFSLKLAPKLNRIANILTQYLPANYDSNTDQPPEPIELTSQRITEMAKSYELRLDEILDMEFEGKKLVDEAKFDRKAMNPWRICQEILEIGDKRGMEILCDQITWNGLPIFKMPGKKKARLPKSSASIVDNYHFERDDIDSGLVVKAHPEKIEGYHRMTTRTKSKSRALSPSVSLNDDNEEEEKEQEKEKKKKEKDLRVPHVVDDDDDFDTGAFSKAKTTTLSLSSSRVKPFPTEATFYSDIDNMDVEDSQSFAHRKVTVTKKYVRKSELDAFRRPNKRIESMASRPEPSFTPGYKMKQGLTSDLIKGAKEANLEESFQRRLNVSGTLDSEMREFFEGNIWAEGVRENSLGRRCASKRRRRNSSVRSCCSAPSSLNSTRRSKNSSFLSALPRAEIRGEDVERDKNIFEYLSGLFAAAGGGGGRKRPAIGRLFYKDPDDKAISAKDHSSLDKIDTQTRDGSEVFSAASRSSKKPGSSYDGDERNRGLFDESDFSSFTSECDQALRHHRHFVSRPLVDRIRHPRLESFYRHGKKQRVSSRNYFVDMDSSRAESLYTPDAESRAESESVSERAISSSTRDASDADGEQYNDDDNSSFELESFPGFPGDDGKIDISSPLPLFNFGPVADVDNDPGADSDMVPSSTLSAADASTTTWTRRDAYPIDIVKMARKKSDPNQSCTTSSTTISVGLESDIDSEMSNSMALFPSLSVAPFQKNGVAFSVKESRPLLLRANIDGFHNFAPCTFSVKRRYKEFRMLYMALMINSSQIKLYGDQILNWPSFPKKSIFDLYNSEPVRQFLGLNLDVGIGMTPTRIDGMELFLVIARDGKDKDALRRRLAVREQHLSRARDAFATGRSVMGGATLNEETLQMDGSLLLLDFPTLEDAKEYVRTDPYVTGKVWEEVEVKPFKLARLAV
ncbi:hypothetical protein HDU97_001866 [Phlyctochytrium planicorne]|nr:hypothetical protein HDU97_001866 [Phlyctochytrium planicorne]